MNKKGKTGENIKTSFAFNMVYQVVNTAAPLLLTPKLSRVFGVEGQGIKSYTFSIVYYFAIFGLLGLDMYGQRQVAIERDDPEKRNRTFWTVSAAKVGLCSISTLLFLIAIQFRFIAHTDFEKAVFYCWTVYLIREMINPAFFLQGMGNYKVLSVLGILSQIAYVVCSFVFINTKEQLPLYVLLFTGIPLAVSLYYYKILAGMIQKPKTSVSDMTQAIKSSIVYFIPTVAAAVYSMVDKTMLGWFDTSKMSTGLYEAAEKLVKVALAFSTASFTIMRTRMTYLHANTDKETCKASERNFIALSMLLCWPIMVGIIGISRDFVPVFFGPGFEPVVDLSYVFVSVVPCLTISGLLQAIYIIPHGLQKSMDIYYGIIVSVNIVMNLLLIHFFGTVGAIVASVFSEMLLAVLLLLKARRDIGIRYIATVSVKYLIASLMMLAGMLAISRFVPMNSILKLIIEFAAGVAIYFAGCIVLRDSFVCGFAKRLIQRLRKKTAE